MAPAGACLWLPGTLPSNIFWALTHAASAPAGCLFPFFGDFLALAGAIGFTPLDFVLPPLLWTWVNKPALPLKAFNYTIAAVYSVVGILAAVGAGEGCGQAQPSNRSRLGTPCSFVPNPRC